MPQYTGIWTIGHASQLAQNGTWVGLPPTTIEYLVVAGGGGGGQAGGGGGAGGLIAGMTSVPQTTQIWVTVGGGGAGSSSNGNAGTNGNNAVAETASEAGLHNDTQLISCVA